MCIMAKNPSDSIEKLQHGQLETGLAAQHPHNFSYGCLSSEARSHGVGAYVWTTVSASEGNFSQLREHISPPAQASSAEPAYQSWDTLHERQTNGT